MEFWAEGPICVVAVPLPQLGFWQVHFGAKPEGWGKLVKPARKVLQGIWDSRVDPVRILGWTPESNRAAVAFARRVGFRNDGVMPTPDGNIVMQGWTLCREH